MLRCHLCVFMCTEPPATFCHFSWIPHAASSRDNPCKYSCSCHDFCHLLFLVSLWLCCFSGNPSIFQGFFTASLQFDTPVKPFGGTAFFSLQGKKVPSSMSWCFVFKLILCESAGFFSGNLFQYYISLCPLGRLHYFRFNLFMEKVNSMTSKIFFLVKKIGFGSKETTNLQ